MTPNGPRNAKGKIMFILERRLPAIPDFDCYIFGASLIQITNSSSLDNIGDELGDFANGDSLTLKAEN